MGDAAEGPEYFQQGGAEEKWWKVANLSAPHFFKIPDLAAHGPKPS